MRRLYHIVSRGRWASVVDSYRPDSLLVEGFVHCSFADQVAGTADRHFATATDLVVIELDPDRLAEEVRIEDSTGAGNAYPHVYGPIPRAAVVAVHELPRDAAGRYLFTPSSEAVAPHVAI